MLLAPVLQPVVRNVKPQGRKRQQSGAGERVEGGSGTIKEEEMAVMLDRLLAHGLPMREVSLPIVVEAGMGVNASPIWTLANLIPTLETLVASQYLSTECNSIKVSPNESLCIDPLLIICHLRFINA